EVAEGGQRAPAPGVDLSVDRAAVRGDDERDRRVVTGAIVVRGQDIGVPQVTVMRPGGDRDLPRREGGGLGWLPGVSRESEENQQRCEGAGRQQACSDLSCGSHTATVERGRNGALSRG